MVVQLRSLGVLGAVFPLLILRFASVVGSDPSICPRCPQTSAFLDKSKLQIIWMKRSVQELYASYVTHMDLQNLRPFCESAPVLWFSSRNITKKPGRLMAQNLYRTFAEVEGSLIALKELQHVYNPEDPLYRKLEESSILVVGLLSNIRCALCWEGLIPTTFAPPKRTLVSGFSRKIEGCRVLWSYSKLVAHLARVFRKEGARGKKLKKRSRQGHAAVFSLTHQKRGRSEDETQAHPFHKSFLETITGDALS